MVDFGSLTFKCEEIYSDSYFVLSESFSYLGVSTPFKVAICFILEESLTTKYLYYPQSSILANTDVNRIMFQAESYSFTAQETCANNTKSIYKARVLIKDGYANESSVDCINTISGIYTYNVSGSSCTNSSLDVSEESNTTQKVSTYPRACNFQTNISSIASPGVAFEITANITCLTTTSEESSSSADTYSAGAATAIVIGLLVLIAAVIVFGGVYYIKVHKKKKVNPDMIAATSPPIDTKEQERNLDGRVSPFSPYPTVSELAVYRFGPSPGPEIDDDDGGMTLEATTPGFTDGRRTMYGKDVERESQVSLPMYSEVGGETPEPTRLSEVHTRMSEISEVNIADPTPFTMTRATMNIPEETRVSPLQTPTDSKPNGAIQSPRDNGGPDDVTL
ncbi:hypothetical protein ACF0H5_011140 [Mactra antiquata]